MNAQPGIVIVGLHFGEQIVRELVERGDDEGPRLIGVCDLDGDRLRRVAATYAVAPYATFDDVLADPAVEAVGLFVPPGDRTGMIRKAIRSGRHVMTTKPFELDVDATADVLSAAKAAKRVVLMNSPRLDSGASLRQLRLWTDQHELGAVVGVHGQVWASYREVPDGTWYDDPLVCPVAPVFRLGVYLINDLLDLVGPISAMNVFESRLKTGRPTSDNAQLSLLFDSGAIGSIYASFCVDDARPYQNELDLVFEHGRVRMRTVTTNGSSVVNLVLDYVNRDGVPHTMERSITEASYGYPWDEFCALIHAGKVPPDEYDRRVVDGVRVLESMRQASLAPDGPDLRSRIPSGAAA